MILPRVIIVLLPVRWFLVQDGFRNVWSHRKWVLVPDQMGDCSKARQFNSTTGLPEMPVAEACGLNTG